jgi:hypothetical protein
VTIHLATKTVSFLRCQNSVGVPESMCTRCLQTLVAPTIEALEQAERRHNCSGEIRAKHSLDMS